MTSEAPPPLPEVSELDLLRHFTRLSHLNFSIETNFYPLGSCTMKYNPKVNERVIRSPGFAWLHPYQSEDEVQGALQLLVDLECALCGITGMDRFSLQPAAGAHGEMTALLMVAAYFKRKGEIPLRTLFEAPTVEGLAAAIEPLLQAEDDVVQISCGCD